MPKLAVRGGLPLVAAMAILVAPTYAVAAPPQRQILIHDECDPNSFPVTCVRNGGVTFPHFLAQFNRLQQVPEWQFTPGQLTVGVNEPFVVTNVGGETHSFTEVAHFGGGVVPALNTFAGATRPECTDPKNAGTFLAPGGSRTDHEDETGQHLYQCCIHPWMHEVVTVR